MRASDFADLTLLDVPERWTCRALSSFRRRCRNPVEPDGSLASHFCTEHQREAERAERAVSEYRRRLDPGPLPVEG